jgi:hypothetical protein
MKLGNNSEDPICKRKKFHSGDPKYIGHLTTDSMNREMNVTNLRAKWKSKR